MNYLEKLLDGVEVEWCPLAVGDNCVAVLSRGRVMSKEYLTENVGDFQVYSSQTANNGEIGRIKSFDYEGEFLTWTTDGANAGTVFHRNGKFSITNVCGLIKIKNEKKINYRFLFFWLSIESSKYVYSGMGNPKLMSNQIAKIPIPIPPLEIQQKIVAILDKFTVLTAELTAELTASKQQYAYYREELYNMKENEVQFLPLGDERIGKFIRGGGLQKKDFTDSGVGCIHYGQIYTYYGTYAYETKSYVSLEFAKKARMAKHGDLVIATTSENDEDVCKAVAWLGKDEIAVSSDACFYNHKLDPRFVAFFFQTEQFQKQKRSFITGAKVRRVNADDLAKIKIPVPSLKEQERIANILESFDKLIHSIKEGLPKEIELRKKQYEYYRNMLLSFPKK